MYLLVKLLREQIEELNMSVEGWDLDCSRESDNDYWLTSKQTGFDFDESQWSLTDPKSPQSMSSSMRENDSMNQYDLLKCGGLNEFAENDESSEDILSKQILQIEEAKHAQKLARTSNPLEFTLKENLGKKKHSAAMVISNMILGQEYSLMSFKGKDEKIELLKAAVDTHDGNAILAVVMFLKSTLKKSIFQREIGNFPDAVNVYLSYLYEDHEIDELSNMLLLLNKPEDAAIFKYDAAISIQLPERKIKMLENCLNTHFQPGTVSNFLRESVLEHKLCIEDQLVLEEHQISSEVDHDQASVLFEDLTGQKGLVDSSALCSLIFCCLYFYNVAQIAFISPSAIKARYKLSQKQFTWCALRALAAAQKWTEIEDLFMTKSWLGGTKMRSCIGFSRVLEVLSRREAPTEVMNRYVCCVESQDLKLFLAKKYRCHSVVIEILKKNRDRKGLIEYKATLTPHSIDFCTATSVLNQGGINWRN